MSTHYESLHVAEDAPEEVIRASYRALSLKHHPDKTGDSLESRRRMQDINDANAILSDPAKRANYDAALRLQRNPALVPKHPVTARGPAKVVRRRIRLTPVGPRWVRGSLSWLSDARVVLPLVAIIWLVIYLVIAGKLSG